MWPVLTQISGTKGFGDCGIVNPLEKTTSGFKFRRLFGDVNLEIGLSLVPANKKKSVIYYIQHLQIRKVKFF